MENTLENIYKASLKFLEPLTPEDTYATIINEAVKLVNADYGSLFLEQDGELKRVYSTLPEEARVKIRRNGFTYQAFNTRRAFVRHGNEFGRYHPVLKKLGLKSDIFFPLLYRGKPIGVLIINSLKTRELSDKELNTLKPYTIMASLAIRKTQLHAETKKALETRDLFISMAAHELRTPLTTINGYTQLLTSKLRGTETPEAKWAEELSWEVVRLAQLVNELLEVNRIRSGKLQYIWRECKMREVVERAIKDFRFTNPNRKVIFSCEADEGEDLVIGDFDKLLQAIINLLDNAAKFSPADTQITVVLKPRKPFIVLQVKDLGHGIPKSEIPKVLEGFYRGSNHSHEGMGLGLFLANNIVRQHHGLVNIRSRLNKGTTIEIKLPTVRI